MPETFGTFIAGLIRRYGTAQAVADAIGMSLSAFSRGVRNEGTLSVENLLKLAEHAGEAPSTLLRLGDKGRVADLIERLYGPANPHALTTDQRELLGLWQTLGEEAERSLRTLLRALADQPRRGKKTA